MYCIGIISKNKSIKIDIKEVEVIYLTIENIINYKNKKWDILIMEDNFIDKSYLNKILNNTLYLLVENQIDLNIKLKNNIYVITFGFHHKSTVTISSVQEDKLIICIQREIETIKGNIIEPMELIVKNDDKNNINNIIIKKIISVILEKEGK